MKISRKAHSKLNLFLNLTGKRKNFHELYSLVVFLDLADEISVEPAAKIEVHEIDGDSKIKDNIIARAAKKLADKYSVAAGAKITFSKNIPLSAGLGGGSADAAATITLLNELWELKLKPEAMYALGLELGADVPVCLYSILENKNAAIISGIGEVIAPAPEISKLHFVLVNPGKELATEKVFKAFRGKGSKPAPLKADFIESLTANQNDLEATAIKLMPEIDSIIKELGKIKTCQLARMSGSGATCFGLFKNKREAQAAAGELSVKHPDWKIIPATLKKISGLNNLKRALHDDKARQELAEKLESHDEKTLRARSFALSLFCHLLLIFLYNELFIPKTLDQEPRSIEISLSSASAIDFPYPSSEKPAATASSSKEAESNLTKRMPADGSKAQPINEADDYLELLQYTVQNLSRVPPGGANLRGLAVLRLEFNREGYVTAYSLRKKTGNRTLDEAALSIARKLMREPFPAAPVDFDRGEKILKYDFLIRYPPERKV